MNENGKTIFYCSKLNKYFLFPFFIPILSIISSKILKYLIKNSKFGNIDYFFFCLHLFIINSWWTIIFCFSNKIKIR